MQCAELISKSEMATMAASLSSGASDQPPTSLLAGVDAEVVRLLGHDRLRRAGGIEGFDFPRRFAREFDLRFDAEHERGATAPFVTDGAAVFVPNHAGVLGSTEGAEPEFLCLGWIWVINWSYDEQRV